MSAQEAIDIQVEDGDREGSEAKMNACMNAMGLAAKRVATAKGDLERAKAASLRKHTGLNSRLLKMHMDSDTINEQEALELAERLSIALYKTIDGLKSILSIQQEDEVKWK